MREKGATIVGFLHSASVIYVVVMRIHIYINAYAHLVMAANRLYTLQFSSPIVVLTHNVTVNWFPSSILLSIVFVSSLEKKASL